MPRHRRELSSGAAEGVQGRQYEGAQEGRRIIVTVKDEDKNEIVPIAKGFEEMGIELLATRGTCEHLRKHGVECTLVNKIKEGSPNIEDLIRSGSINLIINTPASRHESTQTDGFKIRRCAVEHSVPCVTAVDTAHAMLTIRELSHSEDLVPIDVTTI